MNDHWQEKLVRVWNRQRKIREGLVVYSGPFTTITLDQRLHLTIEDVNHETPIASQEICPELVVYLLGISAEIRSFNIRRCLSYIKLFMQ